MKKLQEMFKDKIIGEIGKIIYSNKFIDLLDDYLIKK